MFNNNCVCSWNICTKYKSKSKYHMRLTIFTFINCVIWNLFGVLLFDLLLLTTSMCWCFCCRPASDNVCLFVLPNCYKHTTATNAAKHEFWGHIKQLLWDTTSNPGLWLVSFKIMIRTDQSHSLDMVVSHGSWLMSAWYYHTTAAVVLVNRNGKVLLQQYHRWIVTRI